MAECYFVVLATLEHIHVLLNLYGTNVLKINLIMFDY